ncbi:putative tryptophan/tyrosine transport system substrate-binding protein [Janthinobacterium sp. CG_23.3]|uniref:ABC transporter substrate-binding protein n=1 Tax=unclassified Janthinobacterium TaxID=2610881 RepID=UPI00034A084A|nr:MULTISPECIES: ABC transporter substrate binding protein [unclassified Janthinobacterium]MEC5160971.1 putative ABC transport system substrate-binding protein [Janthinobacterium sp. CG_S6]
MRKVAGILTLVLLAGALPARAMEALAPTAMEETHVFTVEVLQVTDIEPFQEAMTGFLTGLKNNGIVPGKNLRLNRVKIDFDVEKGGFWSRIGVLMRIREEATRIAAAKPDLVLTIGTPATRYARGILEDAGIPLVFTAVADPKEAGCVSLVDGGEGVTGATLHTDMGDTVKLVQQIFPQVRRIGMVHTDDENGVANVNAATSSAGQLGIAVSSKLVGKSDSIVPSLKQLYGQGGVQMFAVPLDTYYGLRKYEPATDLGDFGVENQVPVVTLALMRLPGAVLYVGADFGYVGALSGNQAARILQRHVKPDVMPILKQEEPTVLIDPRRLAALNVALPSAIMARTSVGRDGFWQIGAAK